MNLLLSNDDGVFSEGMRALALALQPIYNITIVAPEVQRSGASHSSTYGEPVRVRKVTLPDLPDVKAYAASGTPADCVRVGCTSLGLKIDMVVSGINHGANLGTHVLYSGTVGAAMEAALGGYPAIATSCYDWDATDFSAASKATLWLIEHVKSNPLPDGMILNLNSPQLPVSKIKGIKLTSLCRQIYEKDHDKYEAPYGGVYYWMPLGLKTEIDNNMDNDERWLREGYCTLTPIHYDITCYDYLKRMNVSDFSLTDFMFSE